MGGRTHLGRVLPTRLVARLAAFQLRRALAVRPRDDLEHLGSEYGGYVVPIGLVGPDSTCYSCGVGEDVTFDLALIARTKACVYAFDPTPRAAAYARSVEEREPRFNFMPVGVWSADTSMRLYSPKNEGHVSHSIGNLQRTTDYFDASCRSVPSIMSELGHDTVDLLKLDVEGAEYAVLASLVDADVDVRSVCVEFHVDSSVGAMISAARRFVSSGFAPVHVEHLNVTFVRTASHPKHG